MTFTFGANWPLSCLFTHASNANNSTSLPFDRTTSSGRLWNVCSDDDTFCCCDGSATASRVEAFPPLPCDLGNVNAMVFLDDEEVLAGEKLTDDDVRVIPC
jgi:hypothetical protein